MFRSWAQAWIAATENVGVMTSTSGQPPKTPWEAHANVKSKGKAKATTSSKK
jgi:hypothetical protein